MKKTMTIKDFDKNINSKILERGYDYFIDGSVSNLEEVDSNLWIADVYGTETYRVEVTINNNEIKSWDCDCPYDQGPICKHVVATFYAIDENMKESEPKQKKGKKKKTKVDEIFSKVSQEDLQSFLVLQFRKYRGLKNALLAHFAELLDEDINKKYRQIIKNMVKSIEGKYGFIDYNDANALTNSLYELLEKSENLLIDKNILEALAICKTIIEELPIIAQAMDDSGGGTVDVFNYAFEILTIIISKSPPMLKDDLFAYFITEYPKQKYHDFGFEDYFLEIIPELITIEEQEIDFFNLIDEQIEAAKKKTYPSFSIVRLIKTKINYLQLTNRESEAQDLLEKHKNYSQFRMVLVDNAIKKNDFKLAKELCNDGIIIAREDQHYGTEIEWYQKLLEISEIEKDTKDIRKYAEHLFFDNRFELTYYRKIKRTYSKDEWSDICERIIDKIKGPDRKGDIYRASTLANIFVEEKYFERLFKLMELNKDDIHFVDNYAAYLKKTYPNELLNFYASAVKEIAVNTGRKIYNEMAKYLAKMKKIEGGEKRVNLLIKNFREQYKTRRAMKEIFDKKFPETIPKPKEKEVQKIIDSNLELF